MCASDVTTTLDQALAASGLDYITLARRPRLRSDNGSSTSRMTWPDGSKIRVQHVRGAPYHRQTHGKIERGHIGP
jgi:RNA-directed DNA polymerase